METVEKAVIATQTRDRLCALLLDSCAVRGGVPVVYAMAGIPGAGKTTFVARALASGMFPARAFILNPDRVMDELPAYHADRLVLGRDEAFARWEMPCRDLAYELAYDAMARRLPVIKDMGLVRPENWQMLAGFRAAGYRVVLHHIMCDVDEAIRRVSSRERPFPADAIRARARALDELLVQNMAHVDAMHRYDNSDLARPFVEMPLQNPPAFLKTA